MTLLAAPADHRQLHAHLHRESWYSGYINSLKYVLIKPYLRFRLRCRRPMRFRAIASSATSICLLAAVRTDGAAAGLRGAVLHLYSAINLSTRHGSGAGACLFNVPLAVWISKARLSVPREIDETAFSRG